MDREGLGKVVRQAWVDYCRETGDDKPSHVAPWDDLGEWDREADRRIGEAVATALAGSGGDGASVRGCTTVPTADLDALLHDAEQLCGVILSLADEGARIGDGAGMMIVNVRRTIATLAAAGATGEGGGE